jgi:hypothetical protein
METLTDLHFHPHLPGDLEPDTLEKMLERGGKKTETST